MEHFIMIVSMSLGKGGVGKSLVTCALALLFANAGLKTGIADYDGGHSVPRTLSLTQEFAPNKLVKVDGIVNLMVAVIQQVKYLSIEESKLKEENWTFKKYSAQFPDDLGLMMWADMPQEFFGIPTDPDTLYQYLNLLMVLVTADEKKFDHLLIDLEPTAGFKRMIESGPKLIAGLKRLYDKGWTFQQFLKGTWPDISAFIGSEYMQIYDLYLEHMETAAKLIRDAHSYLVTLPEETPIAQTFQNREFVEEMGGRVKAIIVNNIRNEPHEEANILQLEDHKLPIARIWRRGNLQCTSGAARIHLLTEIGNELNEQLRLIS
jgi:anion-transporting  ArsA/GET3 family ATPase